MKSSSFHISFDPLLASVCAGLLLLPITNSIGQIPIYFASLYGLVQVLRGKLAVRRDTQIFLGLFAALIAISLISAVHPRMGISKLNRVLFFPFAAAVAAAAAGGKRENATCVALAMVGGVTLLGLYDLIRFPLAVFRDHRPLFYVGNMTSPQFYLVGLCLLLGLRASAPEKLRRAFWPLLLLFAAGLLLHNKRGVWLACGGAIGVWTLVSHQWKILLALFLAVGMALCLPTVRERLGQIHETLSPTHGSRLTLWTHVAPPLFEKYPWGMGYNGSTHEDFRAVLPPKIHLEPGLRHLHNNFLQTRLELGWPGLCLWTLWMASMLWKGFSGRRDPTPADTLLRFSIACALLGLLLNGLVEYNFGDSEVLMTYLALFGLIDTYRLPPLPTV